MLWAVGKPCEMAGVRHGVVSMVCVDGVNCCIRGEVQTGQGCVMGC